MLQYKLQGSNQFGDQAMPQIIQIQPALHIHIHADHPLKTLKLCLKSRASQNQSVKSCFRLCFSSPAPAFAFYWPATHHSIWDDMECQSPPAEALTPQIEKAGQTRTAKRNQRKKEKKKAKAKEADQGDSLAREIKEDDCMSWRNLSTAMLLRHL